MPYYIQLIEQVRQGIWLGLLRPGDQLPIVRDVVSQLTVNANTVLRSYRALERDGVVIMRAGSGTFVASGLPAPLDQDLYWSLRRELESWVDRVGKAGIDEESLLSLVEHVVRERHRMASA